MIRLFTIASTKNFGDAMNRKLIESMMGSKVIDATIKDAQLSAVGSLFSFGQELFRERPPMYSRGALSLAKRKISSMLHGRLKVWGTGFLYAEIPQNPIGLRLLDVHAVRGRLSHEAILKAGLCRATSKVAYGDPGLFYPTLVKPLPPKRYDIGIVPHEMDRFTGEYIVNELRSVGLDAKYINVYDDAFKVIADIAACNCIASSSLHGLIVADALGIPNRQLMMSYFCYTKDQYLFKYRDYYSSYGLDIPSPLTPKDVFKNASSFISKVMKGSGVDSNMVVTCKRELLDCFPFHMCNKDRWLSELKTNVIA